MNEKLKAILLQLATDPLLLKTVQNDLARLSDNGLKDWEKQLKNAAVHFTTISVVLKYLFLLVPQNKRDIVTNGLLKRIILTQAKLPANQREQDFYHFLYICSNQHQWGENGSWLIKILIELPAQELSFILNQADCWERKELFTFFQKAQVLEKLPAEVFLIFLQKLPFDMVEALSLEEMAKRSGSVWDALVDWFNQVAVNPPLGFWKFVRAQQLIKIDGFVNFLAMKSGTTLDFSSFSIDNLHTDGPDNYLSGLIESDNKLKFCQSTPANQMLAYGLLAVCLGRNEVLLKEIQTNTSNMNGESVEIKIGELKKLKSRYEATSPFLKLIAEAKIFPQSIIEILGHSLNLPAQNIYQYLQIAEFLPRSLDTDAGVTKLEAAALKPKPKPLPSTASSMPPPPYPGSSNTFTLPSIYSSPLPSFNSSTNRTVTPPQINPSFFSEFNSQTNFVTPVIIDEEQENNSDDMKINIISYVNELDGYDSNEQGALIDQAIALYEANEANNPEIDAEGWVLQAITAQSESSQSRREKPEKEEKKHRRKSVSLSPLLLSENEEGHTCKFETEQERRDRKLAEQLQYEEDHSRSAYQSSISSRNTDYNPRVTTTIQTHNDYSLEEQDESDLDEDLLTPNLQRPEDQRSVANQQNRFPQQRPTQNQLQQPFYVPPRPLITQPRPPEPFQLKPAITIPVAIVLSLILALALCFSPVGAPLWLIPVLIVSGIYGATIFTLLFNSINKRSPAPPPSAVGYDDEEELEVPYDSYNSGLEPQVGNPYEGDDLNFSQDDFWELENPINQSGSRILAEDPESIYDSDNNFELF